MNFDWLNRYLDSFYLNKNIPGVGISVYRYGELLHTYCTGFQNVERQIPFTESTIVNLFSATKLSTITAGLRLYDRGIIDLEAPVYEYLPFIKDMVVRDESGEVRPPKSTMKIKHLFSMSAGFSYDKDIPSIKELRKTVPEPSTLEVIKALSKEPLLFDPGTRFKYSMCHDVLAAVLEAVTAKKFSTILKEEVFDTIGMNDTAFQLSKEQLSRLAPEYHNFCGKTNTADAVIYNHYVDMGMGNNYESGGGGLRSCLRDYSLLAAALGNNGKAANGNILLKPETIKLLSRNQLTEQGLRDFADMGGWSKDGYGYGFGVRTLMDRERNNSLTENGEFGWDGAMGCYLVADPKTGLGIFYIQQEGCHPWWTWHGTVRNIACACALT